MERGIGRRGKLRSGVRAWLSIPERRYTCRTCEAYVFTAEGEVTRDANGEPVERGNLPTPCESCPKVPRWAKNSLDWRGCRRQAAELTDENRAAWEFWYENRDNPPDDELFRWYAGIIRRVMDEREADVQAANYKATGATLEALITLAFRKR